MARIARSFPTAAAALALFASLPAPASDGAVESLFSPQAAPESADAGPDKPVEVGVRFRANVAGAVAGIRFYKAAANTGKHAVHLWSAQGALLASAWPRGEKARGWQQADFAKPVALEAGKLYVASYHAPLGHISADHGAFAGKGVDRPPLHAPADGPDGANGVFSYGPAGTFPTKSYRSSNYWVDVVFRPARPPADALIAIEVSPSAAALLPGDAVQLSAKGRYGDGSARVLGGRVRWSSGDSGVFTVSEAGLATAIVKGATTVRAHLGAVAGAAAVVALAAATAESEPPAAAASADAGALAVATSALPDAMAGVRYAATLQAAGAAPPVRWAAEGLPTGLRLEAASGAISGAPAQAGSAEVRTTVADARGRSASRALRLSVGPASYSIWPRDLPVAAFDASPNGATEAGVRFRSDLGGWVVAIRYHRGAGDPGSRVVHLWDRDGQVLAEAPAGPAFDGGWHEVVLPRPVRVEPGLAYVASRRLDQGRIAVTDDYFDEPVESPPFRVQVGTPVQVGGAFAFARTGAFPGEGVRGANPWVDVVFVPSAVPPALASLEVQPGRREGLPGKPQRFRAIAVDTGGARWDVTRLAAWTSPDAATAAVDEPGAALPLRAGEASLRAAFRGLAAEARLSTRDPGPLPDEGPGGPILIATGSAGGFGRYLAQILLAEGLNEFLATDASRLDAALLARHDTLLLADMALTSAQAAAIAEWVAAGGNLVAMRPDRKLHALLGIAHTGAALADGYLRVAAGAGPGRGIAHASLQFHGAADLYRLDSAAAVADLYRTADAPAGHPAVTLRKVGRGQAAAFAYDLARSVVYTRQGNPAWSRQPRSGGRPRRSHDLFYGPSPLDPRPDWVDFSRIAIPQADEQQRLLVNLLVQLSTAKRPLPRFWYLPSGHKAAVVMTGDDHGKWSPAPRFDDYLARSKPGCSVEDWQCLRATAYVYPASHLRPDDAQRFAGLGFEIALHATTDCADFESAAGLDALYRAQLAAFAESFPSLPQPRTGRTHCVTWSDYDTQPWVELANGIRLDTTYYWYPDAWIKDRPGFMTGSALPMRFADRAGKVVDVFQLATQMTDESGQTYPATIDALLRGALGPAGTYGVFTANMHTDHERSKGAEAIVAAAVAKGVPVISARQLLEWLDARDGSSFQSLRWEDGALRFSVRAAPGARNLQALLPLRAGAATLSGLERGGEHVAFTRQLIKGIEYAVFPAPGGDYRARYTGP